jgi:hypothetical protein
MQVRGTALVAPELIRPCSERRADIHHMRRQHLRGSRAALLPNSTAASVRTGEEGRIARIDLPVVLSDLVTHFSPSTSAFH